MSEDYRKRMEETHKERLQPEPFEGLVLCLWQCSEHPEHHGWRYDNALRGTCEVCLATTRFEAEVLTMEVLRPTDPEFAGAWQESYRERQKALDAILREQR